MNIRDSQENLTSNVKPITVKNLLVWINQTITADRRQYKSKNRSMSIRRLWRIIVPNLQKPIFIVGSGRSGTTFLGSCLAELPELSYHFEPILTKAAARYVYEDHWSTTQAQWLYRVIYAWLMRIYGDGDLRFVEKQPRAALIIPFLDRAFPNAQFIHLIRDGRDVALSFSKKNWLSSTQANLDEHEPGGYRKGPHARLWVEKDRITEFESTTDIHRCIWAWRRLTEAVLQACSNFPPDKYHELRYESLVKNPINEGHKLLNFMGISNVKSRHLFEKAVERVNPNSVARWQRELSEYDLQTIEMEAGHLLRKLGYLKS